MWWEQIVGGSRGNTAEQTSCVCLSEESRVGARSGSKQRWKQEEKAKKKQSMEATSSGSKLRLWEWSG